MQPIAPTPHSTGSAFVLADGGLETTLIYDQGIAGPGLAACLLLDDPEGRQALRDYFAPSLALGGHRGVRMRLDTPTWRANRDWGAKLGYDAEGLDAVNRAAAEFVRGLRDGSGRP